MPTYFSSKMMQIARGALVLFACTWSLQSCAKNAEPQASPQPSTGQAAADQMLVQDNDSQAIQAQDAHMIKTEITITAPVKKLLPDDTRGLPHQKFLMSLSNGTTLLIAHDTKYAPRVPIQVGDKLTIHGEYIWNRKGGLMHWTHRSDTPRHEGGWIMLNGVKYQ